MEVRVVALQTTAVAVVIVVAIGLALLALPFWIAHKAVITRRQLKVMAKGLKSYERDLQSRSSLSERQAYGFVVAFRSKARFLRWLYWISILTIPLSGWGLLMLGLWALQHSSFATVVRAATGKRPKVFAQELCLEIERDLKGGGMAQPVVRARESRALCRKASRK